MQTQRMTMLINGENVTCGINFVVVSFQLLTVFHYTYDVTHGFNPFC